MTQQNSLPMSDAEAKALAAEIEEVLQGAEWPAWWGHPAALLLARLLADRARDKERIDRYEKALADTPENAEAVAKAWNEHLFEDVDADYAGVPEHIRTPFAWPAQAVLTHLRRAAGMEDATNAP